MAVLCHALCGDDFHQTPVSIIFSENVESSKFVSGFMGVATQVHAEIVPVVLHAPESSLVQRKEPKVRGMHANAHTCLLS